MCVDEIQRIPKLLNEVHRFIEERRLRFVLCVSSARKLKQQGTNLLAGRAVRKHLHPFLPVEVGASFDLEVALNTGNLPVICLFDEWCYWAPADAKRTEVDFLLRRGREWLAIEAKSVPRIGSEELRGLRAVQELRGLRRRILVHPGARPRRTDDRIEICPAPDTRRGLALAIVRVRADRERPIG